MSALHYASLAEVSERLRRRELSPVTLVRHLIERIRTLDGELHSFITLAEEEALSSAAEAEREIAAGGSRGPLHGIPIAVKDSIATRGIRTTANSRALADWIPREDAVVVGRLRAAGAILLGKLNMNEFGWSLPSDEDLAPPPRNPWNPGYRAVGSSSGPGVAVAAGFCYASLGTDGGGSTRLPGGQMGLVGLKPTHGRVPHRGVLSSGTISEVGVLARTAEDAALILRAIAGHDDGDRDSLAESVPEYPALLGGGVRGLKLGVPRGYIASVPVEAEVGAAFEVALGVLRGLGAELIDLDVPDLALARTANFVVLNGEAGTADEAYLRVHPHLIGRSARAYLTTATFLPAGDYLRAIAFRDRMRARLDATFAAVDGLVTPTAPVVTAEAARRPSEHRRGVNASFTAPFNLTGHPGVSIPCGEGALGIPIGFQVVGPYLSEPMLLRVAHAFGRESGSPSRHPDL